MARRVAPRSGRCPTLLGHQTRIELEDIDVVIDAMKRTFCDGCDKRSPLVGQE
jgi:hypothetical protein